MQTTFYGSVPTFSFSSPETPCVLQGLVSTDEKLLRRTDCEMTGLNPYLPREGLREGQPFVPDRILEVS
jgi:hypothetical protein